MTWKWYNTINHKKIRKGWKKIMKKFVRLIAMALIIATVGCLLASCGNSLSGTYVIERDGVKSTLVFKGNKMTSTTEYQGEKRTQDAEFKLETKDGKQVITITVTYEGESITNSSPFEKLPNGNIKIGENEYKKQ